MEMMINCLVKYLYIAKSFKGLVHPKWKKSVINYSPSCHSEPVRLCLKFGTQMKIFWMKS